MIVEVQIPGSVYSVNIGENIDGFGTRLRQITDKNRAVLITNTTLSLIYKGRLLQTFEKSKIDPVYVELPDGEEYKSLDTVKGIYNKLSEEKVERFTPVVAFGGGVIGDIAGFVASTYLRGLPFFNIPTSLIAQVDSSIGGKTGVNLQAGKNLVGTFYQPSYVHVDTDVLSTLEEREYISGIAEVIKHAVISGESMLGFLENNSERILSLEKDSLETIVMESIKKKAQVVSEDEKESGLRRILNLGHTVGHSLEAAAGYGNMRHGEGISVGMVAAFMLSEELGYIKPEFTQRIIKLLNRFRLPVSIPFEASVDDILNIMRLDKKVRSGRIEFVLPFDNGEIKPGIEIKEKMLEQVLKKLF